MNHRYLLITYLFKQTAEAEAFSGYDYWTIEPVEADVLEAAKYAGQLTDSSPGHLLVLEWLDTIYT